VIENNGMQRLLAKLFPAMDLLHRNMIQLQEMIIAKTLTHDRMRAHDQKIELSAVDVAHLQLQSMQTNVLMTSMRHTFHEQVKKQWIAAKQLTGCIAEKSTAETGDKALGAGTSTDMVNLRKAVNNHKSDFRPGTLAGGGGRKGQPNKRKPSNGKQPFKRPRRNGDNSRGGARWRDGDGDSTENWRTRASDGVKINPRFQGNGEDYDPNFRRPGSSKSKSIPGGGKGDKGGKGGEGGK
jgi:hypothetical protein